MLKFPKWKAILVVVICLGGLLMALPNFVSQQTLDELPEWMPLHHINLGLDLRGGVSSAARSAGR